MSQTGPPRAVLLDLLMATMDSMTTWSAAAGSRGTGLAWRDAVTARMVEAGRYVPYEKLVGAAAADLGLRTDAPRRLWREWERMDPWPDAVAIASLNVPFAFVTNCSSALATVAVRRSRLRPAFTLTAEEAGWYKPRSEIYGIACGRLGVDPADARFVAGAPYDASGASAVAIPAVLVARRAGSEPVATGISVCSSLDEALANL
jgi:HAD superfamily hydrolase (TIGR01493 family)